jgi:hypothetical protein
VTTQVQLQKNELPKDMKDMMIEDGGEEEERKYTRKDSPRRRPQANKEAPQAAELIPTKLKSVAAQSFRLCSD